VQADAERPDGWTATPSRVEAFTDGVLAIAITLLVLELRSPGDADRGRFAEALAREWPTYLAYLAAFVMIGSVWLHHHLALSRARRVDLPVVLVNLLLLLTASVLPFPTAVISAAWRSGAHDDQVVAVALFGLVSVGISSAYLALCHTLGRRPELLTSPGAGDYLRAERRRGLVAIAATAVAIAIAALSSPVLALVVVALTPAFYLGTLPRSLAGMQSDPLDTVHD
jgi:uncharacterized membrane protein